MLEPAVVLFLELVFGRHQVGVAFAPEGIDEPIPPLQSLDAEEDLLFSIGDDVDDLLLQPFPVLRG